ncbi:MAG: acylneuraminate cytidylyltransferase [Lachnospiraceae bacterium]|jgi:3-deoxy-D-manno-octulosonate 8-phosphate phosphatase, YrbI family|nr:acylneuraminate cytidylyltransferase [Lachnospiraceae bacterium]
MNVAFIPVRGGSKSIPLKNIKPICGKPLVYWVVKAACLCSHIDKVYIATDSDKIKETVEQLGFEKAQVIGRSAESASDTASTEFAMLEFAEQYEFDNIVLIQATSPLLTSGDLEHGFEIFAQEGTDSVLSVVPQKRFYWEYDEAGNAVPINYDVYARPRRQDFDGCLTENGAFYITTRDGLLKSRNRVSGNIKAVEMCEDSFFEIDEPSDWVIIEGLMKKNGVASGDSRQEVLKDIKMVLTDCDGCLTDAGMYYSEHGDELKKFNTRDGMGFKLLRQGGILTGIITSENVDLVSRRADKLQLDILKMGAADKLSIVKELCGEYQIGLEQVAYVGDDINDLEVITHVGFGCSVASGMECVKEKASYVTTAKGGEGAIREVAELILDAQGKIV